MMQPFLIGAGAGLAAALFTLVPAMRGTLGSALIAMVGFLPIMIAGLAFSPSVALIATVSGAAVIFIFSPYAALLFALAIGLPSWWLCRLAWLARPVADIEPAGGQGSGALATPDGLVWYPLERLFMWVVALGAGLACANMIVQIANSGGFEAYISRMAATFKVFVEASIKPGQSLPNAVSVDEFARFAVTAALPQSGGFLTLVLAINFWLAGRIARSSQLFKRPWMALPDHLRLPPFMAGLFALTLASVLLSGMPRLVGMTCATALGLGFAIQGFATLHVLTRGHPLRTGILAGVYSLCFLLQGLPLLLVALVGVTDSYWNLRARTMARRNSGKTE